MKIKTMTATFGKLEQAKLELEDGLNILEGHNEAGKSTWAGFLRAMLYGIDTRDRDKKGHLAEKNRYQPWSGSPMEGEMTLEWGGREITIRRSRKGNNPFGAFSAVYTGTEEPVPSLTAENCGEILTGVSREVFERSAFIGQDSIGVTATPELEKRITALVSSGEEDVSFSQTDAVLREWTNRRRVNKTVGMIPKLEAELDEVRKQQAHIDRVTGAIAKAEGERAALIASRRALEAEQEIHRRIAQRELNARFAQANQEYETARHSLEQLEREQERFGHLPEKEALKQKQADLQLIRVLADEIKQGEAILQQAQEVDRQAQNALIDEFFFGLTAEQARSRAQQDQERYQQELNQSTKKGKNFIILQVLGLLAGGGIAAAGAMGMIPPDLNLAQSMPYVVGAGTYGAFAAVSLMFLFGKNKSKKNAAALLNRYHVEEPGAITALAEDYAARWEKADTSANECRQIQDALEHRRTRREMTRIELLNFVHGFAPEVKDVFGCSAALSRALGLEGRLREATDRAEQRRRHRDDLEAQGAQLVETMEYLHTPQRTARDTQRELDSVLWELQQVNRALDMAQGEQNALGDPAALGAQEEELSAELQRREQEYEALVIAMKALTAANARMQERFSPELSRLAGHWMSCLTGGKYHSVTLNREMEAFAAEHSGLLPRKALSLSRGTMDQLYLAVRLAVCQLCLPKEEAAPLVLDDALVAFDDTRMELAMDCLIQMGQERQVLLFTCQSREGQIAAEKPGVHYVQMGEKWSAN